MTQTGLQRDVIALTEVEAMMKETDNAGYEHTPLLSPKQISPISTMAPPSLLPGWVPHLAPPAPLLLAPPSINTTLTFSLSFACSKSSSRAPSLLSWKNGKRAFIKEGYSLTDGLKELIFN